jgi:uncharacterized phage protein gp47/JayE
MPIYGTRQKEEILTSILNSLEKDAGITAVYPGSIARAFAEAISTEISDLYSSLNFSLRQGALSTASGRNLDLIGELYGIVRKQISDAAAIERQSFNIEFFIQKPYSQDITVPKDTMILTNVDNFSVRQYRYKLNDSVLIPSGSTRAYGLVIADFSDNTYVAPKNSLTSHNFIAPPGVVIFCNNPKEVYSAINSESDDNYRRRIVSSIKTRAAGTAESVRFAALSVKGVRDVRIRESSYGVGSCDVIVVPENLSSIKQMPEVVLAAISSVRPAGVRFNIRIAEKLAVNVSATISLSNAVGDTLNAGIKNQAALFVKRYLNSLTIGDTISITEIERQIRQSSDYIRNVVISSFNIDGKEMPFMDFTPSSDKVYPAAGNVSIYSVIMGQSNS